MKIGELLVRLVCINTEITEMKKMEEKDRNALDAYRQLLSPQERQALKQPARMQETREWLEARNALWVKLFRELMQALIGQWPELAEHPRLTERWPGDLTMLKGSTSPGIFTDMLQEAVKLIQERQEPEEATRATAVAKRLVTQ